MGVGKAQDHARMPCAFCQAMVWVYFVNLHLKVFWELRCPSTSPPGQQVSFLLSVVTNFSPQRRVWTLGWRDLPPSWCLVQMAGEWGSFHFFCWHLVASEVPKMYYSAAAICVQPRLEIRGATSKPFTSLCIKSLTCESQDQPWIMVKYIRSWYI